MIARSALPFYSHLLAANSLGDTNCRHQFHWLLRLLTADSRHQSCLCYPTHSWFNGRMLLFFFWRASKQIFLTDVSSFERIFGCREKKKGKLLSVLSCISSLDVTQSHKVRHRMVCTSETSLNNQTQLFISAVFMFMTGSLRSSSWQYWNDNWYMWLILTCVRKTVLLDTWSVTQMTQMSCFNEHLDRKGRREKGVFVVAIFFFFYNSVD